MSAKMELYEVMSQGWANDPLDYLAARRHAIVSRFEDSLRYVTLHRENAKTISYGFGSILRGAGSTFGSFSDAVVRNSNLQRGWNRDPNVRDFFDFYSQYAPDLPKEYIEMVVFSGPGRLQPFWGWTEQEAQGWWKAQINVKHSEYKYAREVNLRNATNAVAAVEIILRRSNLNQKGTRVFSPWAALGSLDGWVRSTFSGCSTHRSAAPRRAKVIAQSGSFHADTGSPRLRTGTSAAMVAEG